MLDPRLLRGDPGACATRGFRLDVERFRALEERRKALQVRAQELQNARNRGAKAIGQAKAQGRDIAPLLVEAELQAVLAQLEDFHLAVPNLPHESVPKGPTSAPTGSCGAGGSRSSRKTCSRYAATPGSI